MDREYSFHYDEELDNIDVPNSPPSFDGATLEFRRENI